MATGHYIPPLLGNSTEFQRGTRARVQDLAKKAITKQAAEYVDNKLVEEWIDAFLLTAA